MKRSIISYFILTMFLFSLLVISGCEDEKGTEVEEILDKDQVDVTLIDVWDLWEYQQVSTTRVNKGNRKPSKTFLRTFLDGFGYPLLIEEFYLNIEKHKITLGGIEYSSDSEDIESLHFIDNQMWIVDTDDDSLFYYDYCYNDSSEALWLREDNTSSTVWAVDPTIVDSVIQGTDTLNVNIDDYMLFFRQGGGPKLDLSEPDNNTLISDLTPLFAWEDYPNTTEYILQVRQDTMFSEETGFVINEIVTTNEYQTQEDLENFSGFFWRVKSDNSEWSDIWAFGTYYIITLLSPANNSFVHLKPTFNWEDYDGATEYTIEISEDIHFVDNVISATTSNSQYFHSENLTADKEYFWRVKADNSENHWSNVWAINTTKGVNLSHTITSPTNEESEVEIPVTFVWKALDNAANYRILVYDDSTFANIVIDETVTDNEYTETGVLQTNWEYFWMINSDVSAVWSDTIGFKTNISPLLVSPVDDSLGVGVITQFTWDVYTGAQNYVIQVDENSNFNDPIVDSYIYYDGDDIVCETASRIRENSNETIDFIPLLVEDFEGETQYFWRVQKDSLEWSEVWNFTTIMPTGQVELTTPEDEEPGVGQLPGLEWDSVTGSTFYRAEVCHEETFINTMWVNIITENKNYTLGSDEMLLVGETYYWRVRSDVSQWSEVREFTVRTGIPDIIELSISEEAPYKIDMTWECGSGEHTDFLIERSINQIDWEEIGSVAVTTYSVNEFVDFDKEENTTYYYRMRTENPVGYSSYSPDTLTTTYSFNFDNEPELINVTLGTFQMGSTDGDIDEQPTLYQESFLPPPSDWTIDQNWDFSSGALSFTSQDSIYMFDLSAISPMISLPENVYKTYIQQYLSELFAVDEIAEISVISNGNEDIIWSHSCLEGSWGFSGGTIIDFSFQDYAGQDIQLKFRIYGTDTDNIECWNIYDLKITTSYRTTTLENSFQLGECEITNKEYCEVLNWALGKGKIKKVYNLSNVSGYAADALKISKILEDESAGYCQVIFNNVDKIFKVTTGMDNHPITGVKWFGGAAYTNWLSQIDGLTTLYSGTSSWTCDVYGAEGYRLPTEAEWEFSARGGNYSGNYTYSGSDNVDDVAWHYGNANGELHEVKQKDPNELDTYDISGNLWEWCNDKYDADYYTSDPITNPTGPSGSIGDYTRVVLRGGSWEYEAYHLRNANRSKCKASLSYGRVNTSIGFRIVKINP